MTTFENKCIILGDLWINYREDEEFEDFIEYNDIGLPLAYFIDNKLVKPTELATKYIDETFDILLAALEIEDGDFQSLTELLDISSKGENP